MMTTDCKSFEAENTVEEYLAGRLEEREAAAFELHYFDCDHCLEAIENHHALRLELGEEGWKSKRIPHRPRHWALAAAASVLLILVAAWLWLGDRQRAGGAQLARLGAVEAPAYAPPRLRAAPDEGERRFRDAMSLYLEGRYRDAIPGLEGIEPRTPRSDFYLGACYLLSERPKLAIEALTRVLEAQAARYAEEARYLRGKAFLQTGSVDDATEDFREVARMDGELSVEARHILDQLSH